MHRSRERAVHRLAVICVRCAYFGRVCVSRTHPPRCSQVARRGVPKAFPGGVASQPTTQLIALELCRERRVWLGTSVSRKWAQDSKQVSTHNSRGLGSPSTAGFLAGSCCSLLRWLLYSPGSFDWISQLVRRIGGGRVFVRKRVGVMLYLCGTGVRERHPYVQLSKNCVAATIEAGGERRLHRISLFSVLETTDRFHASTACAGARKNSYSSAMPRSSPVE